MTERVHRHLQLRVLLALGPIVAGPLAALGCRTQRSAVEDVCRQFGLAPGRPAQHAHRSSAHSSKRPDDSQHCACW